MSSSTTRPRDLAGSRRSTMTCGKRQSCQRSVKLASGLSASHMARCLYSCQPCLQLPLRRSLSCPNKTPPERLMLTKSEEYRENARNCGELAEGAKDLPSKNRFKRMQDAWLVAVTASEIET